MKILVVDDSDSSRNAISKLLTLAGYEVVTAINGEDALLKISSASQKFAAVLTDIEMPIMNGYVLTEALRQMDTYMSVPIFHLHTTSNGPILLATRLSKATGVLYKPGFKPHDPGKFLAAITKSLPG
jgi:two-component system chemotaxis response regulator CheY